MVCLFSYIKNHKLKVNKFYFTRILNRIGFMWFLNKSTNKMYKNLEDHVYMDKITFSQKN